MPKNNKPIIHYQNFVKMTIFQNKYSGKGVICFTFLPISNLAA